VRRRRRLIPPVLAGILLLLIGAQTSDALRKSASWGQRSKVNVPPPPDLYIRLDHMLSQAADTLPAVPARDPFAYGGATRTIPVARSTGRRVTTPAPPPVPPAPSRPLLTAIVADNDPRAVIRYEDRNFTVKAGDLFADYRVVSITASEVVLESNGQRYVLRTR
jgi:hypothetical protein